LNIANTSRLLIECAIRFFYQKSMAGHSELQTRWSGGNRGYILLLYYVRRFWAARFPSWRRCNSRVPWLRRHCTEASWFPVVCEIKNDGVGYRHGGAGRRPGQPAASAASVIELPTGTLKRFVIPYSRRGTLAVGRRLLDERGKVRAEQTGLQARRPRVQLRPCWAPGALPAGLPVLRPALSKNRACSPWQRGCCRISSRTTRWCWRG